LKTLNEGLGESELRLSGRFLTANLQSAYLNLALEEAIFRANGGMAVRVWENELSVVIGRGQLAQLETDVGYCRTNRVPVVRRFSAGGAVYNGPGNLNWSFFVRRSFNSANLRYEKSVAGIFTMVSRLVISALEALGVHSRLEAPNRIVNREGKISGMAAYVSREGLLCHGTLLLNADLDEVARLTTPVAGQPDRKYVRSNPAEVSNSGVSSSEFSKALRAVLSETSGLVVASAELTTAEAELMKRLASRYLSDDWNLGDPFSQPMLG
jgi:lipoate-protein ligase A